MTHSRDTSPVAIVTGAAGAIGAAVVERLLADGFTVYGTDLGAALEGRQDSSGRLTFRRLDVANEAEWAELVAIVLERFGRVDVLVNNAGVGGLANVETETVDGWNRVVSINQQGVWLGMRAVGAIMRSQKSGSIVNVSSVLGHTGGRGDMIAYHASKGAVLAMTKNAAVLWGPDGVRVNTVDPGFVETPSLLRHVDEGGRGEWILANTPLGRMARVEEIAAAVSFFAGSESSYATGASLLIDGGWTAR